MSFPKKDYGNCLETFFFLMWLLKWPTKHPNIFKIRVLLLIFIQRDFPAILNVCVDLINLFKLSVLLDPADEKLLEEDIQAPSSSKR